MDKVCFKCGKIKSIDEFYKHPKMKEEEKSIRGLDMQVSIVKIIKQNLVYIKV